MDDCFNAAAWLSAIAQKFKVILYEFCCYSLKFKVILYEYI